MLLVTKTMDKKIATEISAGGPDSVHERAAKDCRTLDFFTKTADNKTRRITATISSGQIDRDQEIISPSAIENAWPGFMRNPVLLAAHQHRLSAGTSPVIGRVIKGWRSGNEFIAEFEFAETSLANEYANLYLKKIQRAFSIGFIPKVSDVRIIDGERIRVHTVIELLEISAVAVPSNRDALSKSGAKKQAFIEQKKREEVEFADDNFICLLPGEDGYEAQNARLEKKVREDRSRKFGSVEAANADAMEWINRIFYGDKQGRLPGEKTCQIQECYPRDNKFLDAFYAGGGVENEVEKTENMPEEECPDFAAIVRGRCKK